jgi:hypothetical protein
VSLRDRSRLGLLVTVALVATACTNGGLAWAPRVPGKRPARPEAAVKMVDARRPPCETYEVIGSVFGSSQDALRTAAAAQGGDGVYDIGCDSQVQNHYYFALNHAECGGRVYVCAGGGSATASSDGAGGAQ